MTMEWKEQIGVREMRAYALLSCRINFVAPNFKMCVCVMRFSCIPLYYPTPFSTHRIWLISSILPFYIKSIRIRFPIKLINGNAIMHTCTCLFIDTIFQRQLMHSFIYQIFHNTAKYSSPNNVFTKCVLNTSQNKQTIWLECKLAKEQPIISYVSLSYVLRCRNLYVSRVDRFFVVCICSGVWKIRWKKMCINGKCQFYHTGWCQDWETLYSPKTLCSISNSSSHANFVFLMKTLLLAFMVCVCVLSTKLRDWTFSS